jgi:arsenical-resistance protein 2
MSALFFLFFFFSVSSTKALVPRAIINPSMLPTGSSRGRGPRAAGWFADYIETQPNSQIRSLVLEGGVKGWAAAGTEYTQLMDGYEASVWSS